MFQLTTNAALTIDETRRQSQIPTSYGVRLSGRRSPSGDLGLQITFVEAPAPSDTVTRWRERALRTLRSCQARRSTARRILSFDTIA